ncbi:hypothetical protein [Pontibacter pudoricolor]|uniref:hypothetical protein n=1 Tax=Pontibacter pudoricolor TaxID=2694930 RepID=UPI001EE42BAE|nr:hypothetical protein [Pontibacter pudoricolor]
MATINHTQRLTIAMAALPEPALFHPLKHHLGYIRAFIKEQSTLPNPQVGASLVSIGTSQLDFYTGQLSPLQVTKEVLVNLQQQGLLQPEAYYSYLTAKGGLYRTVTVSDTSDWVLRLGIVAGRFVHLHPARYAAQTIRVKATSLKTAIAATIAAGKAGAPTIDLDLVNDVRMRWLGLPPLSVLNPSEGAGKLLALLASP